MMFPFIGSIQNKSEWLPLKLTQFDSDRFDINIHTFTLYQDIQRSPYDVIFNQSDGTRHTGNISKLCTLVLYDNDDHISTDREMFDSLNLQMLFDQFSILLQLDDDTLKKIQANISHISEIGNVSVKSCYDFNIFDREITRVELLSNILTVTPDVTQKLIEENDNGWRNIQQNKYLYKLVVDIIVQNLKTLQ